MLQQQVAQICSLSSLPLVVDDPDTKSGFSSILIDLHNGGKYTTFGKGELNINICILSDGACPRVMQDVQ